MTARAFYLFLLGILLIVIPFLVFNILITRTLLLPGAKSFVITSGSMEPVIPEGSIIYTIKQQGYKIGEVITFVKDTTSISHRITNLVKVGSEIYYETKGDANSVADKDLVSSRNVFGKIVSFVPVVGNIFLFYKNPLGLILGTVLPTLLFLAPRILAFKL